VPFASPPVSAPATGTLTRRRFLGATGSAPAPKASRTFDGAFGPIEAPVAPQRVASTDFYTAYALLDVGFNVAPDNSAGDMRRPGARAPRDEGVGAENRLAASSSRQLRPEHGDATPQRRTGARQDQLACPRACGCREPCHGT
jgi:hypothetical protein